MFVVFVSLCLSVFLSLCVFVFFCICLFVFLSFCFFVFLSFCFFVLLYCCIFVFLSFCPFALINIRYRAARAAKSYFREKSLKIIFLNGNQIFRCMLDFYIWKCLWLGAFVLDHINLSLLVIINWKHLLDCWKLNYYFGTKALNHITPIPPYYHISRTFLLNSKSFL